LPVFIFEKKNITTVVTIRNIILHIRTHAPHRINNTTTHITMYKNITCSVTELPCSETLAQIPIQVALVIHGGCIPAKLLHTLETCKTGNI
jgi:hypothetical protein